MLVSAFKNGGFSEGHRFFYISLDNWSKEYYYTPVITMQYSSLKWIDNEWKIILTPYDTIKLKINFVQYFYWWEGLNKNCNCIVLKVIVYSWDLKKRMLFLRNTRIKISICVICTISYANCNCQDDQQHIVIRISEERSI